MAGRVAGKVAFVTGAARGGSIICISSTAGIKGLPFFAPYVAAKHGVVGLAKTMANELADCTIR